ncbi:mutagen-sensitive 101 isoform X2 [Lycorma delicatula]|uniref:mutagen-sensitive 101 isoform X2 n=1 Tax=Lycorma delicatula TaxID=130591 RepID=UPI003F510E9C
MMLSQKMERILLYFLLPPGGVEATSDEMKMAFQDCVEANLNPNWITAEDALKIGAKTDVIVFESFEGETFEYLKKLKCLICGPRCLRTCLAENSPIPEINSPIYMTAMKGLVITATNLPSHMKMKVKEKVGYMGGLYTNNLVESVTHLVCGGVRSVKYDKAAERGITLMTVDWPNAVWDEGLKQNIHATDPQFNKYRCPVFYNLEITTTNLSNSEKLKLKQLVNSNGGIYSGELKQNSTNVLIINSNPKTSKKYLHARSWDLTCVKSSWVYESIEKGFAVNSQDHIISPQVKCSTPTENRTELPSFVASDISVVSTIPHQLDGLSSNKTHVDDSNTTLFSNITSSSQYVQEKNQKISEQNKNYKKVLENLNITDAKKAGSFLDGCKVYLSGFTTQEQDKLRRILNFGGAVIFTELTDSVSHVIIGEFVAADGVAILKIVNRPHVVSVDWLTASLKQRSPALESLYSMLESSSNKQVAPEPPSPLSQKGMQLLMKKNEFKTPAAVNDGRQSETSSGKQFPDKLNSDLNVNNAVNRNLFQDFVNDDNTHQIAPSKSSSLGENGILTKNKAVVIDPPQLVSSNDDFPQSSFDATSQGPTDLFRDIVFMVLGFDSEIMTQINKVIKDNGGCVMSQPFTGITDYTVVPLYGFSVTGIHSEVVTPYWLDDCQQSKSLVPIHYYHQPIFVAGNKTPLENCVISLSIYTSVERQFLSELVVALGALCQETFARKTNINKGVRGSTHLVTPSSGSSKYNAALKWNIPVVTKNWLLACAKHGTKVSETPYLVIEKDENNEKNITETLKQRSSCEEETSKQSSDKTIMPALNVPVTPALNVLTGVKCISSSKNIDFKNVGSSCAKPLCIVADPSEPTTSSGIAFAGHQTPKRKLSIKSTPIAVTNYQNISTPDTPYEEVFAETGKTARKRIKRWMDRFEADKESNELPVVERRLSTPLSEIMRKALRKFGNTPESSFEEGDKQEQNKPTEAPLKTVENANNELGAMALPDSIPPVHSSPAENLARLNRKLSMPTTVTPKCVIPQRIVNNDWEQQRKAENSTSSPIGSDLRSNPAFDSQKNEIGWEEPVEKAEKAKVLGLSSNDNSNSPKNKKFVLSNVQENAKNDYINMIEVLGAVLLKYDRYSEETTHLITEKPIRSEKLLCSIASGRWVLHTSYLVQSYKANTFLPEEDFEWGNPRSKENVPPLKTEREFLVANAAFRWRSRLQLCRKNAGAYDGMKAVLYCKSQKLQDNLSMLIVAGKGVLLDQKKSLEATHCFIEDGYESSRINFELLASRNIYCLRPVYLSDYLTNDPIPNPEEHIIPEYKNYMKQ